MNKRRITKAIQPFICILLVIMMLMMTACTVNINYNEQKPDEAPNDLSEANDVDKYTTIHRIAQTALLYTVRDYPV